MDKMNISGIITALNKLVGLLTVLSKTTEGMVQVAMVCITEKLEAVTSSLSEMEQDNNDQQQTIENLRWRVEEAERITELYRNRMEAATNRLQSDVRKHLSDVMAAGSIHADIDTFETIIVHLCLGNIIQAIKAWRGLTGQGLVEAKRNIDDVIRRAGFSFSD